MSLSDQNFIELGTIDHAVWFDQKGRGPFVSPVTVVVNTSTSPNAPRCRIVIAGDLAAVSLTYEQVTELFRLLSEANDRIPLHAIRPEPEETPLAPAPVAVPVEDVDDVPAEPAPYDTTCIACHEPLRVMDPAYRYEEGYAHEVCPTEVPRG